MIGESQRTIVIVGAGYCGTLVAINLLREAAARPLRVVLVERGTAVARGVAYAARDYPYVLNVPASAMSATSSDPDEFLRYAQQHYPSVRAEDFLPRELYGDYLDELLRNAAARSRANVELALRRDTVVDVITDHGLAVKFSDGTQMPADDVVLALGNPPAANPCRDGTLTAMVGVRPDPWTPLEGADSSKPLLIIGSGLTMADVVCATLAKTPQRRIYVVSRHGLIPPEQTSFQRTPVALGGRRLATATSVRRLMRDTRKLVRELQRLGGDWRTAIATVRHAAPSIWRALPLTERRRFLRHVRSYWDIHRHRLPGAVRARIEALHASGQLRLHAGRIVNVESSSSGELNVQWRPRRQSIALTLRVSEIANCTGPDYDVRRSADPLLCTLAARGTLAADELGLGLRTGPYGVVIGSRGQTERRLYYVGPMLRSMHWEATAAAELRGHAEALARHLVVQDRRTR